MHTSSAAATAAPDSAELFLLSDEQILEIAPESSTAIPGDATEATLPPSGNTSRRAISSAPSAPQRTEDASAATAQPGMAVPTDSAGHQAEPPAWLVQLMADPETGAEARDLWQGVQQARAEAAAYREAFATPDEARALKELYPGGAAQAQAAAERAHALDEIDAAYFGRAGASPEQASAARAALAERMMRENPAAFREMVFAGLRVLQNATEPQNLPANVGARFSASSDPLGIASGPQAAPHASLAASRQSPLSAYAAFEQAANADLERSVGDSIERTIARALPNLAMDEAGTAASAGARTGSVSLRERLAASIRQDVEQALQSDRQLGEQIAKILSARRFDGETRAQVVRLIGDRARQIVPGVARRVIGEWTQSTLAAHRARTERSGSTVNLDTAFGADSNVAPSFGASSSVRPSFRAASSEREPAQAASASPASTRAPRARDIPRSADLARNDRTASRGRSLDYRKLSDEQILDL